MKKERYQVACSAFYDHFKYFPADPQYLDDLNNEWADTLEKSVNDDFDYTIEKYGTIPPKNFGLPETIID
ncbi:MAG: hypothetical protein IJ446_01975 [Oscillospiraceae bacterium]|nr:hypothetical protein [Oscillospiraceae bacterium]